MAAISAGKYNPVLKPFYERMKENLPAKEQGVVAEMSKLLILIYFLWKSEEDKDAIYQWSGEKRKRKVKLPAQ